jgi:transposase-like protein
MCDPLQHSIARKLSRNRRVQIRTGRMAPAEQVLKNIRRQTRRQYSAEEKIRIVLEGLRGEENISEFWRGGGIAASHALICFPSNGSARANNCVQRVSSTAETVP